MTSKSFQSLKSNQFYSYSPKPQVTLRKCGFRISTVNDIMSKCAQTFTTFMTIFSLISHFTVLGDEAWQKSSGLDASVTWRQDSKTNFVNKQVKSLMVCYAVPKARAYIIPLYCCVIFGCPWCQTPTWCNCTQLSNSVSWLRYLYILTIN